MVDPITSDGTAALSEIEGSHGVDIGINASGTDAGINLALEAADLTTQVDHPTVAVALDTGPATFACEDLTQIARSLGNLVGHVHLRDAIGQHILVVPGDGTVDFAALACAVDEIGYWRAAVVELEYEVATAAEVRPDLS